MKASTNFDTVNYNSKVFLSKTKDALILMLRIYV